MNIRKLISIFFCIRIHSEISSEKTIIRFIFKLSNKAHDFLINEGFSERYGAREMDRAIRNHLNTLLMKEILFGRLKEGGKVRIEFVNGALDLKC